MMISSQQIYEDLKGKSDKQLLLQIRKYRKEISQLKSKLESQELYEYETRPSPEVQILCIREYIDKAKQILFERGVEYKPTIAEQRSLDFNARLPEVSEIHFVLEGYFIGCNKYTVICGESCQTVFYENRFKDVKPSSWIIDIKRDAFICELQKLHIGEWKSNYYIDALDGAQWEITFNYNNGTKRKFKGSNAYPYNFDDLMDLLGIENEE